MESTRVPDRIPRVLCIGCFGDNDETYNYCQHCGVVGTQLALTPRRGGEPLVLRESPLESHSRKFRSQHSDKDRQPRQSKVIDAFGRSRRPRSTSVCGWEEASPAHVVEWLCHLDSQGKCTKSVHAQRCPEIGRDTLSRLDRSLGCTRRYALGSLDKSLASKLKCDRAKSSGGRTIGPLSNKGVVQSGVDWVRGIWISLHPSSLGRVLPWVRRCLCYGPMYNTWFRVYKCEWSRVI